MTDFKDSIAHTAHGYVHGERAKTYGHPRFDFKAIAKVWTGLLSDKLKPGEELDEYRVPVLMSGLKLCRLVKSPSHIDSRIDTIGYMLTMERLDEPEEEELNDEDDEHVRLIERANKLTFSQAEIWFEAGETKTINGQVIHNDGPAHRLVFPLAPGTNLEILPPPPEESPEGIQEDPYDQTLAWQPPGQVQDDWVKDPVGRFWFQHGDVYRRYAGEGAPKFWKEPRCTAHGKEKCEACSQNPDPSRCQCGYFEATGMHWDTCPGRIRTFPKSPETKNHEIHGGPKDCWCGFKAEPLTEDGKFAKGGLIPAHNHEFSAPCIPDCPAWAQHRPRGGGLAETAQFEFTGETVDMTSADDDRFPH